MNTITQLADLLTQPEERLAKLRSILNILIDDPTILDQVLPLINQQQCREPEIRRRKRSRHGNTYRRIRDYFTSHGNAWSRAMTIATATGISETRVNGILHSRSRVAHFDKQELSPKEVVFRLAVGPEAPEAAEEVSNG